MDLLLLTRGLVLGFSIAAVVGPIALLCIRRTLSAGFGIGFVSGLGAATADASYAAIAGFGVSAVAVVLVDQRVYGDTRIAILEPAKAAASITADRG